jgi:hypothetical protein
MKTLIISIIGLICISYGFDQDKCDKVAKDVDLFEITNPAFFNVLDTVLMCDSLNDYYTKDLLYSIIIVDESTIQIGPFGTTFLETTEPQGVIQYKHHLFFIEGYRLDDTIFARTDKKYRFLFTKDKSGVDPETGIVTVSLILDDTYDIWLYNYVNGNFLLKQHFIN